MNTYCLGKKTRFGCLGAACPDSCCVGWDVVIDDDTAMKYRELSSALGDCVRSRMTVDEDGDTVFSLSDGRCPFLRKDGLCEIWKQAGEDTLSVTCRRFPRIEQEYADFTECCLSLACPEGARRMLADGRLRVPRTQTDDPLLRALLVLRGKLIRTVRCADRPFGENFCRCMSLALDWDDLPPGECVPDAVKAQFRFYGTLDLMTERFRALCAHPLARPHIDRRTTENAAVYYLYRYLPQAVTDLDVTLRVQMMLAAVTFLAYADADPLESARLFAKEIEHSYENMERLSGVLTEDPAFSPASLCALWREE